MLSFLYKSITSTENTQPSNPCDMAIATADKLIADNHYDKAIVVYSNAIQSTSNAKALWSTYKRRSEVFLAQGNLPLALIDCERAIELHKVVKTEIEQSTPEENIEVYNQQLVARHLESYQLQLKLMEIEDSTKPSIDLPEDINNDFNSLRKQVVKNDGQEGIICDELFTKIGAHFDDNIIKTRLFSKAYLYENNRAKATEMAACSFSSLFIEYKRRKDFLSKKEDMVWHIVIANSFKYLNALEKAQKKAELTPMPSLASISAIGFHSRSKSLLTVRTDETELVNASFYNPPAL